MTDWRDRIGLLAPLIVMAAIALCVDWGLLRHVQLPMFKVCTGHECIAEPKYLHGFYTPQLGR